MKALFPIVALSALSLGQSANGVIAGSWTAEFAGRNFIRLELRAVDGAIAGGLSLGSFAVDAQGAVMRADEAPRALTPIHKVTVRESTVTFFRQDGDGTDQFVLRVLDAGAAELQIVVSEEDREELAASGVPAPKPIRLRKTR